MYPAQFDYYRATSVDNALALLSQHSDAKVIAGGHSLLPAMKLRLAAPGALIDIGRIGELKGITQQGNSAMIGALSTHAMVAAAPGLPAALTETAAQIGDPAVRNRGTIGGNVAHADPASDLPAVLTALNAIFHIASSRGRRSVSAGDFFVDIFATDLEENEILTAIEVPLDADAGTAYVKFENPASRYSIIGAAAMVNVENGVCSQASVVVGGLTPKPTRAHSVEAALTGKPLNEENIAAASEQVRVDCGEDVMGDIHASAVYRLAVAPAYVARALSAAAARAA